MKIRGQIAGVAMAVAAAMAAPSLRAETIPEHLASLAGQLYRDAKPELESPRLDPEHAAAAKRALEALRRAGVRYWARDPVRLRGSAAEAAKALDLDLTQADERDFLARIMSLDEQGAREALGQWYAARGVTPGEKVLNDHVAALAAARSPSSETLARSHQIDLGAGERVELRWNPDSGDFVLRAESDGGGDTPEYESTLIGRTTLTPNPETGDLDVALAPGAVPAHILTAADLERLRASILGEWRTSAGAVWRISAGEPRAGEIRPTREQYEREIADAKARLKEIEEAREFVWEDPASGEIVRQRRFRRLSEPFVYKGERFLVADAEAQIEKLKAEIAALEAERDGAGQPPAQRFDPVGHKESRRSPGARPVRIEVRQSSGYGYAWDEASFDGRRVTARRTYRDVRDINLELPAAIKRQLIASWSPPGWLELEATIEPASGTLTLAGREWALHVTYFEDGPEVEGIHTPYSRAVRLERPGTQYWMAYGAADNALP